jgi:hypothetical protein
MFIRRNWIALLSSMLIVPAAQAGTVQDAASNYEVPTYELGVMSVQGEDLLAAAGEGGDTSINTHVGASYFRTEQSPMRSVYAYNQVDTWGTTEGTHAFTFAATDLIGVETQKYIGDSRGLNIYGGVELGVTKAGQGDASGDLAVGVGAGYGRMVDARFVAQAAAIFAALEREATAEDLLRVAEVLGQRTEYGIWYPWDADLQFFSAVAGALGELGGADAFVVSKVLDTPLYNISARNVGWELGVRVYNGMGDLFADESGSTTSMAQFFSYGKLLDDSTGVTVSQTLSMGLADGGTQALTTAIPTVGEGSMALGLGLDMNKDHSYNWSSTCGLDIAMDMPADSDATTSWAVGAQTNRSLDEVLIVSLSASAGQTLGTEDFNWTLAASFMYLVF